MEKCERKAELYDKLAKGELPDEEEQQKYCVDFFNKSIVRDDSMQAQGFNISVVSLENEDNNADTFVLFNTKPVGPGRTAGIVDNDEHKRFIREVHEEANQARDKASELKLRRQEQATSRREKLRQAYLDRQLEKVKAAAAATAATETKTEDDSKSTSPDSLSAETVDHLLPGKIYAQAQNHDYCHMAAKSENLR